MPTRLVIAGLCLLVLGVAFCRAGVTALRTRRWTGGSVRGLLGLRLLDRATRRTRRPGGRRVRLGGLRRGHETGAVRSAGFDDRITDAARPALAASGLSTKRVPAASYQRAGTSDPWPPAPGPRDPMQADSSDLIQRAQQGDQAAFEQLYRPHG